MKTSFIINNGSDAPVELVVVDGIVFDIHGNDLSENIEDYLDGVPDELITVVSF